MRREILLPGGEREGPDAKRREGEGGDEKGQSQSTGRDNSMTRKGWSARLRAVRSGIKRARLGTAKGRE